MSLVLWNWGSVFSIVFVEDLLSFIFPELNKVKKTRKVPLSVASIKCDRGHRIYNFCQAVPPFVSTSAHFERKTIQSPFSIRPTRGLELCLIALSPISVTSGAGGETPIYLQRHRGVPTSNSRLKCQAPVWLPVNTLPRPRHNNNATLTFRSDEKEVEKKL